MHTIRSITDAFSLPKARTLFTGIFIWRTGFGFWTTFAVIYLTYRFNVDQATLGNYFLYTGAWLILSQLFFVSWVGKRFNKEGILYASVFFTGLFFSLYLIPRNFYYLFLIIPFLASSNALTFANIPATVSAATDKNNQGKFSGMNNSVQALALSIAPILSGYISASLSPLSVVAISSILMVLSGTIFLAYSKSHSQ